MLKFLAGCVSVIAILYFCFFSSWSRSATERAIRTSAHLVNSLEHLKLASTEFERCVSGTVESARDAIRTEPNAGDSDVFAVELSEVAEDWAGRWKDVRAKALAVESAFDEIESSATSYWDQIERITNEIVDTKIRQREVSRNQSAREAWTEVSERAGEKVKAMKLLVITGDDFHRVLVVSAMRSSVSEYAAVLDEIANEAVALLDDLESLSEEGRALIASSQSA